MGWCGAKDWRMPTVKELERLADLSIPYPGPTLDTAYFNDTNTVTHPWYLSSTPYAKWADDTWYVHFASGTPYHSDRRSTPNVRLVRGGQ